MSKTGSRAIFTDGTTLYSLFNGSSDRPTVRLFATSDERSDFRHRWNEGLLTDADICLGHEDCKKEGCTGEICLYYNDDDGGTVDRSWVFIATICRKHMVYRGPWDIDAGGYLNLFFEYLEDAQYLNEYRLVLPLSLPIALLSQVLELFRRIKKRDPRENELRKILTWQS